jgi:calcineurin-like phosphoesterase family protein
MIWFGSDLHFNHDKVLEYCNRPFATIEEMNESFYKELDDKIKEGDTVYLLGDIVMYRHKEALQRIRGHQRNIHLIVGNHDNSKEVLKGKYWASISYYEEIKINDKKIVLFHYPIECWNAKSHGSIHLHGHTHNNLSHPISKIDNRMDVGYDATHSLLISYEEVLEHLNKGKNEK